MNSSHKGSEMNRARIFALLGMFTISSTALSEEINKRHKRQNMGRCPKLR